MSKMSLTQHIQCSHETRDKLCQALQGRSQKLHVGGAWCAGPNPTPICLRSPTVLRSYLASSPTSLPK